MKNEIWLDTKVRRSFIVQDEAFVIFRKKSGDKGWYRLTVNEDDIQIDKFQPKSDSWDTLLGGCRLHIRNGQLFRGKAPLKAIRMSGGEVSLDDVVQIINLFKKTNKSEEKSDGR